jgi:hypothetical protein
MQAEGWFLEQPEPGVPGLAHSGGPHLYHYPGRIRGLAAGIASGRHRRYASRMLVGRHRDGRDWR